MPLNFPTTGLTAGVTTYTFGGNTWIWNGYAWDSVVTPDSVGLTAYVRTWNGQTGNVTFSNYVTSVNGLTGAVTGIAVTGSNTFTGLQTMNAGISASDLVVSGGVTFGPYSYIVGDPYAEPAIPNTALNPVTIDSAKVQIGDVNNTVNGLKFVVDNTNPDSNVAYLYGNLTVQTTQAPYSNGGTISSTNLYTNLIVPNSSTFVEVGGAGHRVRIGDGSGQGNGTQIYIRDNTQTLDLINANGIINIGDVNGAANSTKLIVDDTTNTVTVNGNLVVSGGVTSTFSENVLIEDNFILLNSNVTAGGPTENAGIEVSRGASANVQLRWNETTDNWQFTNDGTQFYNMPTSVVNTINGHTGAFTLTGTANEVEITGATSFVVGLPDTVTITNLTVTNSVTASTFDGSLLGRVTTLIKNDDTITLTAGMPVYISGYQGSGNSGILLVKAADSSNSSTMPAVGLVETTLAVNGQGRVVELGLLGSLNTNGFSANQVVYIAPGGGLTATRPTAGTHLVQNIGRVVNASTNQGQIIVLGPGRSNDVPNRITVRDYLEMPNGQTATSLVTTWNGASGAVTFSNYVTSVNGSTGAVTNVAKTDTAQTFTAIQSFTLGFTADGATFNSNLYAGTIKGNQLNVQNTGNNLLGDVTGVLGGGYIQVDNSSGIAVNNVYGTLYTDGVRIGRGSAIPALSVTGAVYTSGLINTTGRVSCAGITSSGVSTFTGSLTANNLYVSQGVTFNNTSVHTGLGTFNGGITSNNLYVSQGATFANTVSSDTGYRISSSAVNTQTGTSYSLTASDNGKIITMSNGATSTVTIIAGLPVGFNSTIIQLGTGQVGFTAASGVTLNSYASAFKISGQHGAAGVISYSSNVYNISGTLSV